MKHHLIKTFAAATLALGALTTAPATAETAQPALH